MRVDGPSQQAQLARDHGDVAVVVTLALPDGQALVALDLRRLAGPALAEIIEGGDYMTILEDLAIEANEALEEPRQ